MFGYSVVGSALLGDSLVAAGGASGTTTVTADFVGTFDVLGSVSQTFVGTFDV